MEVKSISIGFRANNPNNTLTPNLPATTGQVNFGNKWTKLEKTLVTGKNPEKIKLNFEDTRGLLRWLGFELIEGGKGSHCTAQKDGFIIGLLHPHGGENRQPEYVNKSITKYLRTLNNNSNQVEGRLLRAVA